VAFAATMRPGWRCRRPDDVSARDTHGMILDDAAGGHDKSPGETVADSESRALLKTARGFGVQQKVQQLPPTVGTQHHRRHTDIAGTAAKREHQAAHGAGLPWSSRHAATASSWLPVVHTSSKTRMSRPEVSSGSGMRSRLPSSLAAASA
jgi:hypothetical protein